MAGHGQEGRRGADGVLAMAFAKGYKIREAAKAAGIGERTASRRLRDPEFRKRVQDCRGRLLERAAGLIARNLANAVGTMADIAKYGDVEAVRLRAAMGMIDNALKFRDLLDLQQRVHALERLTKTPERKTTANMPQLVASIKAEDAEQKKL